MAEWIQDRGALIGEASAKLERDLQKAVEEGDAGKLADARIEAARLWPRLLPAEDGGSGPGLRMRALALLAESWGLAEARRARLAQGWAKLMDPRLGALGEARRPWLLWALRWGARPKDAHWADWAEVEGVGFAVGALGAAAEKPGPAVARGMAARAALAQDVEALASCAELVPKWDWTVPLGECPAWAQAAVRGHGPESWSGRIPILQLAALGAKAAGDPRTSGALAALASIPEARRVCAERSVPRALARWRPAEVEWAGQQVPELLAPDGDGRVVAHAWMVEGAGGFKRIRALAAGGAGWMLAHPDSEGVSALSEARRAGPDQAAAMEAAYAEWERRELGGLGGAGPGTGPKAAGPRL